MKKCPYCGKEYPDDVAVCVTDGNTLLGGNEIREKVTGVWRGVYGIGKTQGLEEMRSISFTLKLKQGWATHFTGSVTDDPPQGVQGVGSIDGYFGSPMIEFTKRMPIGYIVGTNGTLMTLREYILAAGRPCEKELPSPPIFYQGTVLDADRMQGTWIINQHRISLADGSSVSTPRTAGYWCARFITTDTKGVPTGGPTGPLFDKTLLSQRELEEVEGVAFHSLGQFNISDAEKCLDQFGQEGIRFELKRDDDAMSKTMPVMELTGGNAGTAQWIEMFVHPDDEQRAAEIVGECIKLK
jgi:hypothetical protein